MVNAIQCRPDGTWNTSITLLANHARWNDRSAIRTTPTVRKCLPRSGSHAASSIIKPNAMV